MTIAERAADHLHQSLQSGGPLPPLADDLAPTTPGEAYAIGHLVHARRAGQLGATVGYKLAYTVPELQQAAGLDEPLFARLTANSLQTSPATVDATAFFRPGVECEVAFRLGHDLPPRNTPYTRAEIIDAIDAVMPAIEVLDLRLPDGLDDRQRALLGLTVGIWNAGVVLGDEVPDWREIDLAAAVGRVEVNDQVVAEGTGGNVMGHPLEPLVWLANTLGQHGLPLAAGMTVITGSFVRPVMLQAGDQTTVVIEGLGTVAVQIGA